MNITKKNRNDERRILIALIVDDYVLSKVASKWVKTGLFASRWSNLVGTWCIKFYEKYNKAPMNQIENLYESWAAKTHDTALIKLVEKFLDTLSQDYEDLKHESNSEYLVDLAGQYFNRVRLEKLSKSIQGSLDIGDIDRADAEVTKHNRIELGVGEGIAAFQDEVAIKEAFKDRRQPLIRYKGALGKFFRGALERDAFIAFLAPEKRGKSLMLADIAYRAMLQKRRVVYFEAGDMSQNQIMRRLMVRVSKRPMKRCIVKYPTEITRDGDGAVVTHRTFPCKRPLNYETALEACKKLTKQKLKSDDVLFKLSSHPNSSLSIKGIRSILEGWERDGWVPDVIVIDYADILDMGSDADGRERINEAWKQLRGLSQEYHCLVVTATQANAASYKAETIDRTNFSEDKRKLAHVTGMIGINTTDGEKEKGIIRLNWIVLRDDEYNTKDCVYVATCFELGNPTVLSCF